LGEDFVRDAHLDVISLTGKQLQGFVLSLPAKTSDGAIIAVVIESAANTEIVSSDSRLGGDQRGVVEVFDETGAKDGSGDTKDNVVGLLGDGEAGLWQAATAGAGEAGDGEEIFDAAIGRIGVDAAIGIKEEGEAHFAGRTVGGEKRRVRVGRTAGDTGRNHGEFRVGIGARAANAGLRMAARALIEVEAGAKAIVCAAGDNLDFLEPRQAVLEKFQRARGAVTLHRRKRKRTGSGGSGLAINGAGTHSGVGLSTNDCGNEQN